MSCPLLQRSTATTFHLLLCPIYPTFSSSSSSSSSTLQHPPPSPPKPIISKPPIDSLIKQVMASMLHNTPLPNTTTSHQFQWTPDSVIGILRAVPKFFFQSARSVGRQTGFRRRAPLKPRNLRQEALDSQSGRRLRGPAAYRNPFKIEFGMTKSLEFYFWVEQQCGFLHNESTCREMSLVLAKANELKTLWQFLREMANRDCGLVTTSTVTCIVKALGEEGLINEALAAFYRMKQLRCKPDVYAYNTVICALCRVGNFKKARFLLDQMEIPGSNCPPDTFTYTILISFYCKRSLQTGCRKAIRRRIWEANHLFRVMLFKGYDPDVVTYNCLIDGLCKTYRIERALELFDDMILKGCMPNRVTYNSLIRYYSAVNEIDKAVELIRNMRLRNHGVPTSSSYTPIIHALCEVGRVAEALDFLVEMVSGGSIPRDYTYKLVRDALSSVGASDMPDELCRRIEDGINNRYRQVMRVKPMLINKFGL